MGIYDHNMIDIYNQSYKYVTTLCGGMSSNAIFHNKGFGSLLLNSKTMSLQRWVEIMHVHRLAAA